MLKKKKKSSALGLSRETDQEEREIYIKDIYYEELAHVNMEAEKSHSLPSASWRLRKASGVVQS